MEIINPNTIIDGNGIRSENTKIVIRMKVNFFER